MGTKHLVLHLLKSVNSKIAFASKWISVVLTESPLHAFNQVWVPEEDQGTGVDLVSAICEDDIRTSNNFYFCRLWNHTVLEIKVVQGDTSTVKLLESGFLWLGIFTLLLLLFSAFVKSYKALSQKRRYE